MTDRPAVDVIADAVYEWWQSDDGPAEQADAIVAAIRGMTVTQLADLTKEPT